MLRWCPGYQVRTRHHRDHSSRVEVDAGAILEVSTRALDLLARRPVLAPRTADASTKSE
jgi:hypothetical protein